MGMKWKDEHLVWNPTEFAGLTDMVLGFDEIWTPDFTNWNELGPHRESGIAKQQLTVNHNGSVQWWPAATFRTACYIDLTDYPFDSQVCRLYFGTWVSTSDQVTLKKRSKTGVFGPYDQNQEWRVTSTSLSEYNITIETEGTSYSALNLTIAMTRISSLYAYYIGIPYALAIGLSLSAFFLPLQSQVRLAFYGLALLILLLLTWFLDTLVGSHSTRVPYASEFSCILICCLIY